jgi:hypothetical protein
MYQTETIFLLRKIRRKSELESKKKNYYHVQERGGKSMFMFFRKILLTLLEFSHACSCSFEEANLLLEVKCLATVMELHLYLPLKPEMKSYIYRIRQKQQSSMYLDEIYRFGDGTEWLRVTVVSFRHPNPKHRLIESVDSLSEGMVPNKRTYRR